MIRKKLAYAQDVGVEIPEYFFCWGLFIMMVRIGVMENFTIHNLIRQVKEIACVA